VILPNIFFFYGSAEL